MTAIKRGKRVQHVQIGRVDRAAWVSARADARPCRFATGSSLLALAVCLCCFLFSAALLAQPTSATDQAKLDAAAKAYDEGVRAFDRAEFARAGRAFLKADQLLPTQEALSNALSAAVRAGDHLLVTVAAERAVAREEAGEELRSQARKALAFAATKLARVNLNCEPKPCGIVIDGEVVNPGARYLLPGNHSLVAVARDGHRSARQLDLAAGTSYRVVVHAGAAGEAGQALQLSAERGGGAVAQPETPELHRENPGADRAAAQGSAEKPLPPWVFYSTLGLSVVAVGLTSLSGLDAMSAKSDLGSAPPRSEVDAVESKITRTDVLFGVSLFLAASTTYIGVFQVNWGKTRVQATPLGLTAAGQF